MSTAMLSRAPAGTHPPATPPGRRNGWRLVIGALVTVTAATGFAALQIAADTTTPVLVVTQPVAAGQVITANDVRVADLRLEPGVEAVRADQAAAAVGRTAAVPLTPGSLLAPSQIGPPAFPSRGEAVVAVSVRLPPAGLTAGSQVLVLMTPSAPAGDQLPVPLVPSVQATVVQVGQPDSTGTRTVSLLVRDADAEAVASAAAVGTVSLVVTAVG
jgi:Flp pilus assembly protein CpaB